MTQAKVTTQELEALCNQKSWRIAYIESDDLEVFGEPADHGEFTLMKSSDEEPLIIGFKPSFYLKERGLPDMTLTPDLESSAVRLTSSFVKTVKGKKESDEHWLHIYPEGNNKLKIAYAESRFAAHNGVAHGEN